jgi:glycosyltransferase involved in cell wall biosynthesis
MRILHVNKFLYRRGGAEGYMLDVAALQVAAGHQVAFFGMEHPDNPPQRFARHLPAFVRLEPPPAGAARRAAAAARMVWSSSSRRGMDAVVRAFRPDVAHAHNLYHQLSPSVLRPLAEQSVPVVLTLHDYKLACPSYQLLDHGRLCDACLGGRYWRAAARRCKDGSLGSSLLLAVESGIHRLLGAWGSVRSFISPSRFMAETMCRAGVYPDRLELLDHFVDARRLAAKATPGGPLVFAGRLAPEKGVDVLIEAMALLGPEARLEIAGEGAARPALEALAAARAPGRVRFLGRLPKDRLLGLVRGATAVAVPSLWHENQPMAVLESFACGVPVVVTDLGGLPELVEPGRDGEIVPAGDPAGLAAALAGLLGDPERALAMGVAGRAKVERRFEPGRHLAGLERIYRGTPVLAGADRLLGGSGGSRAPAHFDSGGRGGWSGYGSP